VWLHLVGAKAADPPPGRVKAALGRITGFVLIGLGVRLGLERR
jgi:hypothetical protein